MILVLADDLTGALEVGAVFASSGLRAIVSTRPVRGTQTDALILDTETRHSTPSDAVERIVAAVRESEVTPDLIYKKTDSTLRGNIRSELAALSKLFPPWRIGYAPAYPAQGRTVKNGRVHVNGIPLTETDFARDDLNPVFTSSVRELVGELSCTIFDGVNEADIDYAAVTILSDDMMRIAAGPTALARALASQPQARAAAHPALPRVATCLVVNGSRTEVSRSQERYAERQGCLVRSNAAAWALVDAPVAIESVPTAVASSRADHVIDLLRQRPTDGVLIIGGDTAYAFVSALGSPPIYPIAELLPGVPISRIGHADITLRPADPWDVVLITKAGGFGDIDVLCRVRQILEQNAG